MRRLTHLVLVAAAGIAAAPARAGDDDPLRGFSAARALAFATELSSDAMKGRKTGFEGGALVEDRVREEFGRLGLDPMDRDGDYLEPFSFDAADAGTGFSLAIEGAPLSYRTDFTEVAYGGTGRVTAEVVYVGYGISAPDRGWDDYDGVDAKGRIVLAIRGAPASREAEFEVRAVDRLEGRVRRVARRRGLPHRGRRDPRLGIDDPGAMAPTPTCRRRGCRGPSPTGSSRSADAPSRT